jgi:glutaredoxin
LLFIASAITVCDAQDVVLKKVQRGDKVLVIAENKSEKEQLVTLDVTLENVITDRELPVEIVIKPGEKKELLVLSPVPLKAWSYKTRFRYEEYIPETEHDISSEDHPGIPNKESGNRSAPDKNSAPGTGNARNPSDSKATITDAPTAPDYFRLPPGNTDDEPMPAQYARRMNQNNQGTNADESQLPESELIVFSQDGCPRCAMTRNYLSQHDIPYKELIVNGDKQNQKLMNNYLFDSGFKGGNFMMPVVVVDGEAHYSIKDLEGFLEGLGSDH